MACQTCNGSKSGAGNASGVNQTFIGDATETVTPPPRGNTLITIEEEHEAAETMGLKRGTYKVFSEIEFKGQRPVFVQNQEKAIPVDGELKRVFFHKVEIKNIRPLDEFRNKADLITEFTIIDNIIPLAPVIWGASIIGSGVAGYFFVDKVQEFTETTTGSFITVAASVLGIIVGIKVLSS